MNWYKKTYIIPKGLLKTAVKRENYLKTNDHAVGDNQAAEYMFIFDVQRYAMDSYAIRTSLSKTLDKLSVGITCNQSDLGGMVWCRYWYYDLNEFDKAKATYEAVNKSVKKVVEKFVDEEIPTPMLWAFMRKDTDEIDPEANSHNGIPYVNYLEQNYRKEFSPDWRSNIYGTRYPKHHEVSYRQHKNK